MTVYTIGHSNRSIEEFIELLEGQGIRLLLDVRRYPGSRLYPHFGKDALYAIDANLDLLDAIDFHKGCYIGQELTSRMKRRGQIKNRILGYVSSTQHPAGSEVLKGDLRAGETLGQAGTFGLGLMRLDRIDGDLRTISGDLKLNVATWLGHATQQPAA